MRKEAKTYGTCRLAEGGELDGQRLCIIEDVVTSGGAILDAAVELRAQGAMLGPVVCVIDRESGGVEKLAAEGLELHPLFRMHELNAVALAALGRLHPAAAQDHPLRPSPRPRLGSARPPRRRSPNFVGHPVDDALRRRPARRPIDTRWLLQRAGVVAAHGTAGRRSGR